MSFNLPREQYRLLQYNLTEFFIEHSLDVSRAFDGDMQMALILGIVGQVYLRGDEQGRLNSPITASRIADASGIPRQTVRRKLQALEKRGWVYQTDSGAWLLVEIGKEAAARFNLAQVDARGIERLLKLVRRLKEHI